MKGYVRTEECNSRDLESGTIVVYHNKDVLEICAVMHFNPDGDWVITGQTFDELVVPVEAELCKLIILTDSNMYPLKFNQWDKAIKNGEVNSDKSVNFELTPVNKFKEGKRIRACDVCETSFMGGGTQFQCRKCNDADAVAQIKVNKKVKPKRPRMLTPDQAKLIARESYGQGYDEVPGEEFEEWLEKQF
jgi:hypothetical protein